MIKDYFLGINKKAVKKSTSKKATSTAKTGAKKTSAASRGGKLDVKFIMEKINSISPTHIGVEALKPIDQSGFSPEGSDFVAFERYCDALPELFKGYVPFELLRGAFFFQDKLTKVTLGETLGRVTTVKKINKFAENESTYSLPSFIVAGGAESYPLLDIKNDIVNYYISRSIESEAEFELMAIVNYGMVIKDWSQGSRSFTALETGEDTLMWFFVLMNEYLEIERDEDFDLRSYIKNEKAYNEY